MTPTAEAPDVSTTGRHIPALDGLRGLAILLVLMCHLLWSNPDAQGNLLVRALAHIHTEGWVGVSLFFVLSGFLITGILYDTLADRAFFRNFYARRMLRIFPLYYGFLLLLFMITRFTHNHWYIGLAEILTYTQNLHLVFAPFTDTWWINLNHFWTLAIEEQFYLVWPLLVYLLRTRRRIVVAAAVGMVLSLLIRLAWVLFSNLDAHPYVLVSWTPSQLDGLLFGAVIAMAIRSRWRTRALRAAPAMLCAGALPMLAIWVKDGQLQMLEHPFAEVIEPLLLALTFGGLLLWSLRSGTVQRVFAHPALRFFGRYSYGLYVYHYTLAGLFLGPMRTALLARGMSKMIGVLVPGATVFVVSIGVAWLSFRYFEEPFLRLKDRFTHHSRKPRLAEVVAPTTMRSSA